MLEEKLQKLFDKYGAIIVDRMIDKMNALDVNATGAAARSLKYETMPDGIAIRGKTYFAQIDKGRPAASTLPPIGPIYRWVQTRMAVADEKEAKKVAYAVQKTIAQKGTIKRFGYGGTDLIDFIIKKEIKQKFQPEAIKVVKAELLRQARELKKNVEKKQ